MKKILLLVIIGLILFSSTNVSAFFVKSHLTWEINGMNNINSPITQKCKPYMDEFLDGETGADMGVLHYGEDRSSGGFKSYYFFHTKSGFEKCIANSKDDKDYCRCIGVGTHIVEDYFSHLKGGVVDQCLRSSLGSNYYGHMSCERDFENKHLEILKGRNDYVITSGKLEEYNSKVFNTFFVDSDGAYVSGSTPLGDAQPSDGLTFWSEIAGFDMTTDAKAFRNGYLNEGFYNTVYKDKIALPIKFLGIPLDILLFGIMLIGAGLAFIFMFYGRTKWRYLTGIIFILLALLCFIGWYSTNPVIPFTKTDIQGLTGIHFGSWQLITWAIEIPPKFGLLSVPMERVKYIDTQTQTALNQFLNDGILRYGDATGLSYVDDQGNYLVGALDEAEKGFKYFLMPLLIIFFIVYLLILIIRTFGIKTSSKILNRLMSIILWAGTIIILAFLGIIGISFLL